MRKIDMFLYSLLLLLFFFRYKINYDENKFLADVSSGKITSKYDRKKFIGTWFSDRSNKELNIKPDGRWSMANTSGTWALDGDKFVWVYDKPSDKAYGRFDSNPIKYVDYDRFVLSEVNGSESTFTRINK